MTYLSSAGGFGGCHASECGNLGYAEARPGHTQLGDQASGYDGLDAVDAEQRSEVLTYASLNVGRSSSSWSMSSAI